MNSTTHCWPSQFTPAGFCGSMWTTAACEVQRLHARGKWDLERIIVWLREGLKVCIIFLPLRDSLQAGTASLKSTAQLSAAQRAASSLQETSPITAGKLLFSYIYSPELLVRWEDLWYGRFSSCLWCIRLNVMALKFPFFHSGIFINRAVRVLIEMRLIHLIQVTDAF